MRALVVDDSRAIRSILSKMLRELGFQIFEAAHGGEALDVLDEHGAMEVVLVDWNMPVLDGYEFLCRARADGRYASTPIMMVTTESEVPQVQKALAAGASEYLMKPFTKEAVLEKLQIMGVV